MTEKFDQADDALYLIRNSADTAKDMPVRQCNRSACRATETAYDNWWWNWSTRAWYCQDCALAINEVGDKCCILESNLPDLSRPQAPAEGEVAEAINLIRSWPDDGYLKDRKNLQRALETLIQAATRSSQTGAEGLVKALDQCRRQLDTLWTAYRTEYAVNASDIGDALDAAEEALAAHRKQTDANNEKREG